MIGTHMILRHIVKTKAKFSWLQTKTLEIAISHIDLHLISLKTRPPTIQKGKKNHSSNIGFYILHHYTSHQNTLYSILTPQLMRAIFSLHRLSLCLVNIKSQVREYQKNKKKHPFRHGVCRSINPRVQSAANSTIEKSFLFSSRLFRYAYNRMTRGCIL